MKGAIFMLLGLFSVLKAACDGATNSACTGLGTECKWTSSPDPGHCYNSTNECADDRNNLATCNDCKTSTACELGNSAISGCQWTTVPGILPTTKCTHCAKIEDGADCSSCDSSACNSIDGCTYSYSAGGSCSGTMSVPYTFKTDGSSCNGETKAACEAINSVCKWTGASISGANYITKDECVKDYKLCGCYNSTTTCSYVDDPTGDAHCSDCKTEDACNNSYQGTRTCRWSSLYNGACTSCGPIEKGESCSSCDSDEIYCGVIYLLDGGCKWEWSNNTCSGEFKMNGAMTSSIHVLGMMLSLIAFFFVF